MKNSLIAILIIVFSAFNATAEDNKVEIYWKKGTQLYQQKQYDSAAAYFEKIAVQKPGKAEVYYNLGNAYYRMNKVGLAVLNYQRALQLNPDYQLAQDNLAMAENRMTNHVNKVKDIFFVTWWENITAARLATLWAILAFIVFSAIVLVVFLRGISKIVINIPVQVPILMSLLWVLLLVFAFASAKRSENSGLAVVMQNDAPLQTSDMKGKPISLLPEGTTVRVKSTHGEFAEVVIPDGRRGFVLLSWLTKV